MQRPGERGPASPWLRRGWRVPVPIWYKLAPQGGPRLRVGEAKLKV